jgi:hypothetical protein
VKDMSEWKKAQKKPVIIDFREPKPSHGEKYCERLETLEGIEYAVLGRDLVIKGVKGELYPIKKDIFALTYDVI